MSTIVFLYPNGEQIGCVDGTGHSIVSAWDVVAAQLDGGDGVNWWATIGHGITATVMDGDTTVVEVDPLAVTT